MKLETRDSSKSPGSNTDAYDILYFVGCTASFDVNVKEVGINTVNIFDALGLNYGILGNEEKCCGSVMLRIGDKEFERLADYNIRLFNSLGIRTLVTSCAGCLWQALHSSCPCAPFNANIASRA